MSTPEIDATSEIDASLSARAATVALRLADRVAEHGGEGADASSAVAFLRQWAEAALAVGIPLASTTSVASTESTTAAGPVDSPLDRLAERLALGPDDVDLVLLAGLAEEHEGLADVLRHLTPGGQPRPNVGLAALLLEPAGTDRAALRRLLVEGAGVRSGLLVVGGDVPFFDRSLGLAEGLWSVLHGLDAWPDRLSRVDVGDPTPGLEGWLALPAVARARAALGRDAPRVLVVSAVDETIALGRVARLAGACGRALVAARLAADDEPGLRLLTLHAAARGAVPVVMVESPPGAAAPLRLGMLDGPIVVCARPGALVPPPNAAVMSVPVLPVGAADRRLAWSLALPASAERAAELAARHPLDPAVTVQVARDLNGQAATNGVGPAEVSAAIRSRAAAGLPLGVDLRSPEATWADLVLDDEPDAQLRDAVDRLVHQDLVLEGWGLRRRARADRGVRLLMAGPPGTGKTLAAEVLAAAAQTDLLVVDVAQVVSKWVGETEKNLAQVFDVAERTQAVLLLDEADGLFSSRTEVTDAHDKYLNLQTTYLLQRLDRFDGLAVLATNLLRAIDVAFLRRMDFVVEFAMPDAARRERIWDRHLPEQRDPQLDLTALAERYPVPGGWIRNAVIGASYAAAARGVDAALRTDDAAVAMRREYAKASKPFPGLVAPSTGERDESVARRLLEVAT